MLKKKIAAALAAAMLVGAVMTTGAMAETVQFGIALSGYSDQRAMKSAPNTAAKVSVGQNTTGGYVTYRMAFTSGSFASGGVGLQNIGNVNIGYNSGMGQQYTYYKVYGSGSGMVAGSFTP